PAARAFYTATPQDPHGVTLRRRFRADGRRLLDIADEALDGSIVDGAAVGDFLLEELERNRDLHMRDIVATIQADQYRLITHDPDSPLVVQGERCRSSSSLLLPWITSCSPVSPARSANSSSPSVET